MDSSSSSSSGSQAVVTYLFVVDFQVGDGDHVKCLVTKFATLNLLEEISKGELHNADVLGARRRGGGSSAVEIAIAVR